MFTAETLRADIRPLQIATVYTRIGDAFAWGVVAVAAASLAPRPLEGAMTARHRCRGVAAMRRLTPSRRAPYRRVMGITLLDVTIGNLADRRRTAAVECIVDSGAIFAIVPARVLRRIGVRADRSEEFTLADGTHVRRRMGDALFDVAGQRGASPVIFGEPGDATVIGAVDPGDPRPDARSAAPRAEAVADAAGVTASARLCVLLW